MAEKGSYQQSLIATYVITMPPQVLVMYLYGDFYGFSAFLVTSIFVLVVMSLLNLFVAWLNLMFMKNYPCSHVYNPLLFFYSLFAAVVFAILHKALAFLS